MGIHFGFLSFFWKSEKNKFTFPKPVIFIRLNFDITSPA